MSVFMENAVPILTANYMPLRFVLRRDSDAWQPSIEQINNRDYDYVKLHRISTYIDIGIAPYSLGVCFDGTLILPAIPKYRERLAALAQFNGTLSELLLGGIYCEAVTPDDIGYGNLSLNAYARISGGATGPAAAIHFAARTKHIGTLDVIKLLQPETITVEALHTALKSGRELIDKIGKIPREQVLYGATFYVQKQWAEALLHIWTTIERLVELAWQKYVIDSGEPPSKKRRAFLDDHRTWPIATKLEVLFQKRLLHIDTYKKLDAVRKARNDFIHSGVQPTHEITTLALKGCFELASLCASKFEKYDLFEMVVDLIVARCNPSLFPRKTIFETSEISHWLPLPPLPGDKEWGDKEFEIIEDLCLKPIEKF